jgi:multimeric flavodoxin WrbA
VATIVSRRNFLTVATAAASAHMLTTTARAASGKTLILGISGSPRKGKTTATAVQEALNAAEKVDSRIETELVDLGGLEIAGSAGASSSDLAQEILDDFQLILPSLKAPNLGGIIIGSPVYFRSLSALCKAFLERIAVLRKPELLLADVPVGALAVGAYRNGGQELVIEQIQAAMLCHEVMIVGGKPRAHQGATLWNNYKDDILKDEFGIVSARNVGTRVAEVALKLQK